MQAIQKPDRRGDLRRRSIPLHSHRNDHNGRDRPATIQNLEHVANRGPGWAGDQGDGPRVRRQSLLSPPVEVAFLFELLTKLLQSQFKRTDALGHNLLDDELALAFLL